MAFLCLELQYNRGQIRPLPLVPMTSNSHFIDALIEAVQAKSSCVVAGLDTDPRRLPQFAVDQYRTAQADHLAVTAKAQLAFNEAVIDAVCFLVPAVKLEIAGRPMQGWAAPPGLPCRPRIPTPGPGRHPVHRLALDACAQQYW